MKIKKGDEIIVISGKDKGSRGKVLEVYPGKQRVLVEKINMISKHQKATRANKETGILQKEAPLHVSKVMLVDPKTGEPTRVKMVETAGKKVRVAVRSGEMIDKA